MEELANYNEWPEGINHLICPGDTEITIPPGAKIPSAARRMKTDETATDDTEADTDSTEPTRSRRTRRRRAAVTIASQARTRSRPTTRPA